MIDWARARGATINPKIEIRSIEENLSGIFAKEPLEKGEVVSSIPWDLILKSDHPKLDECDGIRAVHKAITKNESQKTPYEKYLSTRSRHHVPSFWSQEGKDMLTDLVGNSVNSLNFDKMVDRMLFHQCKYTGEVDERVLDALMISLTRAEGPLEQVEPHFVPFNDNINHRNGRWFNTDIRYTLGSNYELVATRRIEVGEQLHSSYNQCPWCEGSYRNPKKPSSFFVTPQLFIEYGFVESMPQRWVFPRARLLFDLDDGPDGIEVHFAVPPSDFGVAFIRNEISRLRVFKKQFAAKERAVPENELQSIQTYYDAVLFALTHAHSSALGQTSDEVWKLGIDCWYWEDKGSQCLMNEGVIEQN